MQEELNRAYAAILDEARAHVAAGRDLNSQALEGRIRAAGQRERARDPARRTAIDQAEQRALQQLGAVATVHRARALMARQPAPSAAMAAAPSRRATLRARPTISGNMDVRRHSTGETLTLSWDAAAAVANWEVRFSERRDARADYAVRETLTLPAATTTVELPLSEYPLRVHLLGRSRDGRLLRRALISALTRETWNDRWQRRASAS
ncbi:MAG: hypothetical protein ABR569_12760 [Gaiellaceae bacterium]